jgi:hypothetical protein
MSTDRAERPGSLPESIGEICERFAQAWLRGQEPRVEDFATAGAENETAQRELLIALIRCDLQCQWQRWFQDCQHQATVPGTFSCLEPFPARSQRP